MTSREEAIRAAAMVFAQTRAERDAKTPRQAAEDAYYPGHRLGSVEAIEALIIRQRAEAEELWRKGIHPYQLSAQREQQTAA